MINFLSLFGMNFLPPALHPQFPLVIEIEETVEISRPHPFEVRLMKGDGILFVVSKKYDKVPKEGQIGAEVSVPPPQNQSLLLIVLDLQNLLCLH